MGRLRPIVVLRNLRHAPLVWRNREHYRRFGIERSVFRTLAHRDVGSPSDDLPWLDRADGAGVGPDRLAGLEPTQAERLRAWSEQGFMVLEGFYTEDLIDRINHEVDDLVSGKELQFNRGGRRVRNAFGRSAAVAAAVGDPRLHELLGLILEREIGLWQTITFFDGSRQAAHSDAFHMTTEPLGNLIGAWVALEDVHPDSGPVFYVPGSHRLPYVMSEDLDLDSSPLLVPEKSAAYNRLVAERIAELGTEPVPFLARKGDVLLWHANLLHGGAPIADPARTRRSLVAHFYGKGVLLYHDVTERPGLSVAEL